MAQSLPAFVSRKRCLLVLLISGSGILQSCGSNGIRWNPDEYTVKSGDTVYSIAWRYELDPKEFARWNGVDTGSFLIRPGQRLHVKKPSGFKKNKTVHASSNASNHATRAAEPERYNNSNHPTWVVAKSGDTLYGLSRKYHIKPAELAQLNQLKKPYPIKRGQTIFLRRLQGKSSQPSTANNSGRTTGSSKSQSQSSKTEDWAKHISWQWPVKGKLLSRYKRNKHNAKGIDIAGSVGKRINAVADGKVVYSGNGLISYGNLIIIKHNRSYLSAYAYNRKLLVKEGQWVSAGQKIAEMGQKDKSSARLHFEIRRNGKPVDPLRYLP